MSVKKYLISIQKQGLPRYDGFFSQSSFNENDFKVYGIVGTNLPTNIYFELGVKNKKIPMTPSELGCTLSHLKALEDFIKSDSEYAYIFEDDVKQKKSIDFNVDLSFLGKGFIVSLGGIELYLCRKVKGQIVGELFGQPVLKVNPFFYDHIYFAMGYIVDKKSAQAILNYHQTPKIYDHWKDFLLENQEIKYFMLDVLEHPEVANLNTENNSLENERKGLYFVSEKPKILSFIFRFLNYRIFKVKKKYHALFNQFYPKSKG